MKAVFVSVIDCYTDNSAQEKLFRVLRVGIPEDAKSIFDVGCTRANEEHRETTNLHAYLVKMTDTSVKGIDIQPEEIQKMLSEGYDVTVGDAQTFKFDQTFDAIVAREVIEYLPRPGQFIERVLEHLSNDGRIIFTTETPNTFAHWRKAASSQNVRSNVVWIQPENVHRLANELTREDVEIRLLSPRRRHRGDSLEPRKTSRRGTSVPGHHRTIVK